MVQYDLGTIPDGVTVTRHGETLNCDSVIYWGDELTFAYTETSVVLTGNTKFESGYKWAEKATTTYSLSVGGKNHCQWRKIYSKWKMLNLTIKFNNKH